MANTPMVNKLKTNTTMDNKPTVENRTANGELQTNAKMQNIQDIYIHGRGFLATLLCRVEQLISMKENGEETVVSRRVCFN
ncbi:hypothetical protein MAR_021836 [Mya arenaria]|uniref:Uncharacterized protein n=1 Tax=Mya arenaria TaxID=6604 RepID=A0ABY7EC01_MYAAR|nr:hypothetical protein MAR_021836 [Mya arenaria]